MVKTRAMLGPSELQHLVAHVSSTPLHHVADAAQALYNIADGDAAATATAASTSGGGGPFGFLTDAFEAVLEVLEDGLDKAGVPYAYGFAIILLTVIVKVATFPLSKQSMQSTLAVQALSPKVKELQARYAADQETLQLETARLYREAGVNPLAGCLPTLATIPVFIGLYRALTKAADQGLLTDGFFWIPSLAGPASLTQRQAGAGLSWLFPFQDGAPPIGWHDAIAYLILPVLLVVSQYISQVMVSPQSSDPSQKQSQAVLKFIPLMIGWFSLNVPSGLTLYWFVNNIFSTAQQMYMRQTMAAAVPAGGGDVIEVVTPTVIKPKEERVNKVSGKELGARKKKRDGADSSLDEDASTSSSAGATSAPAAASGGGGGRGNTFRARKAREAAAKAAQLAGPPSAGQSGGESAPAATAEAEKLRVPDTPPSKG